MRVEPHWYRDTPIFREMLYERMGRFPGTPEGWDDGPEPGGVLVRPQGPKSPTDTLVRRLVPVTPVFPVAPPSMDTTQPIALFEVDDEADEA